MDDDIDRTASLMTPAQLARVKSAAQPPASPAAFLDRMAADVGVAHVARLSELGVDLSARAAASPAAAFQPPLERLAQALPQLDFGLLAQHKGWWAGLTGKSRTAGAGFAAQFGRIEQAADALVREAASVQQQQQPHARASDRTLLEFDVEYKALDKVIDQGARWLQDLRKAPQQTQEDAARCEILAARLKALRAAAGASQQVHQQARATAERRAALLQAMQQLVTRDLKAWRENVSALAAAAEGRAGRLDIEEPRQAQAALQQRLAQLLADCGQLRTAEAALVQNLAAMAEQLQAAG
jgi:hypothetical protein